MSTHARSEHDGYTREHEGYTIRRFEPHDRDAFLSLHADIFDDGAGEEWFTWKYENNPYLDDVGVFVAEDDDGIVGGLGCFGLVLATGAGSVLAVEPGDAMVHPDHRRQGLYLELMRAGMEYYGSREPEFYFDLIPGTGPYHGNHKHLDWKRVDELPTYYRIQNPASLLENQFGRNVGTSLAGQVGRIAVRGYHAFRDRAVTQSVGEIDVERQSIVPAETFAALYRDGRPHRFHALRDERFYRWRYNNPQWEYAAYVARRDGTPVAGIVTGTRQSDGVTSTRVMDVVPMTAGVERAEAFAALLGRILEANRDTDVLAAPPEFIPHGVLTRYGFRRDDVLPISIWSIPYRHGVRPFDESDDALVVDGMRLTDRTNWMVSFAEQDTS